MPTRERPDPTAFGAWLRSGRLARRWTQRELARLLDYDVTYIRKIERGERPPSDAFVTRLAQVLGLPPSALPLGEPARRSGLPKPATPLVGRDRDAESVCLLLENSRLVTLLGSPGIGKTRVGIEVASRLEKKHPGRVCFVSLAEVDDAGVADAIAAALPGAPIEGRVPPDALVDRLQRHEFLLVLDNFEHVLNAATLVRQLLDEVGGLRLLVTSRAALGLSMEAQYWVPPLAVPDPEDDAVPEKLAETPTVALYLARARMVHPEFSLAGGVAPVVAETCRRLQGLPLAIELAAATAKFLSPQELLAHLGDGLDLSLTGPTDAPVHQKTLRAAIDWSYRLLAADERDVFATLAVFAGGFTLEALSAMLDGGGEQQFDDAVGHASSLVFKSLLEPTQGAGGTARFVTTPPVRAFALEQLREGGQLDRCRRRHAEYFARFAERAQGELVGASLVRWLALLDDEHANLRAALSWSLESDAELAMRLAGALWRFWWIRGHLDEGREALEAALALGRWASPEQVRALNGAGVLIRTQGDYAVALERFDEAAALAQSVSDDEGLALALLNLGMIAKHQARTDDAFAAFERARLLYGLLGDDRGVGHALNCLGLVHLDAGATEVATDCFRESLTLFRAAEDQWSIAHALTNLGWVADQQGHYELAHSFHNESFGAYRSLGDERGVANALSNLGLVSLHQRDFDTASAFFEEALLTFARLGDRRGIAECLEELAMLAQELGDDARAARLFGAVRAVQHRVHLGDPAWDAENQPRLAELRSSLGDVAFRAAWEEGRARSITEAVDMAVARSPRSLARVPAAAERRPLRAP